MPATALFLAAWAALTEAAVAPSPDAQIAAALVAAMPADGMTDVVLIDHPATPRAPRVRVATAVRAEFRPVWACFSAVAAMELSARS